MQSELSALEQEKEELLAYEKGQFDTITLSDINTRLGEIEAGISRIKKEKTLP